MSLIAKKKPSVPPIEAGTYISVCVGVVDLGTQYSEAFKKSDHKVMIIFEIPSVTVEVDGEIKPRWLSQQYSVSLNEKSNLYKTLTSWRGRALTAEELSMGFDISAMIGQGCMIQITVEEGSDGGQYNKLNSVIGLPAGVPVPQLQNPAIKFDMDAWDDEVFKSMPDWIQDKVRKSQEYEEMHAEVKRVAFDTPQDAQGACPI